MYYERLEPFGEERADLRSAQIAQLIAEPNRDPKRRSQPFKLSDFMFDFDKASSSEKGRTERKPITDPAEWEKITQRMMMAYGGKRAAKTKQ